MTASTVYENIDLLPDVTFVPHDTGEILAALVTLYEETTKTTVYDGDPVRLFLSTVAAALAQRSVWQDYTGKMNLVRYAEGDFLDNLGALLAVYRNAAACAGTEFEFALAAPLDWPVDIPAGTRMTADSKLLWETDAFVQIPAGKTSATVHGTALTAGTAANGLVAGQINRLVDRLPAVVSVKNIKTTTGGADVEPDESFRRRIILAPEKFTTAGSALSYVYWALSCRPDIHDVLAYGPKEEPGQVYLYVLVARKVTIPLADGTTLEMVTGKVPEPDGEEIKAVEAAVSAEERRPLTDNVHVRPPAAVRLSYRFTWYITASQAGMQKAIEANIIQANAEYEVWQSGAIGRDINPDELIRKCREAGAKRIEAVLVLYDEDGEETGTEPYSFTVLAAHEIAEIIEDIKRITFGGAEEE